MTGDPRLLRWLAHRSGLHRLDEMPLPMQHYNLEGNRGVEAFLEHYGARTIRGIVGFVDVVGFSTTVQGRSPEEVAGFLEPFLKGVCDIVSRNRGLVDKMIGDEIMFVVPELLEDGGAPARVTGGLLLTELATLQRSLGGSYRMRAGLAYGPLFVSHLQGEVYLEWSILGETVHLAKRIMGESPMKDPSTILCGVAGLCSEVDQARFEDMLQYLASTAWSVGERYVLRELKGVSASHCAYLSPREPNRALC